LSRSRRLGKERRRRKHEDRKVRKKYGRERVDKGREGGKKDTCEKARDERTEEG
jgi:hypothetical protein